MTTSPFHADGTQFAFDSSTLIVASDCLRKYYYRIKRGLVPKTESVHLLWGGIYASSLERFYKLVHSGQDRETALLNVVREAMTASYGHEFNHDKKTRVSLIRSIIWYIDDFGDETYSSFKTWRKRDGSPAVELSFMFELSDDILLTGHLDRVVEFAGDKWVMDQKSTGSYVGKNYFAQFDPDIQMCQPAGTVIETTVGPVPIEQIKEKDQVLSYHQDSPQLRGQPVIARAERPFTGNLTVISALGHSHKVTPNHRVLVRYLPHFRKKYAVYIMRRGNNFRVGYTQISTSAGSLMGGIHQRCRSERANDIWVLSLHDNKKAAWLEEQIVSEKYNLPQVTFKAGNFKNPAGLIKEQRILDKFWLLIGDNSSKAAAALYAYGREMAYPIYTASAGRTKHVFSSQRAQMVRACNLLPGVVAVPVVLQMTKRSTGVRVKLPIKQSNDEVVWIAAEITKEPFAGMVYSLEVKKAGRSNYDGCYVANRIVTGNSLYSYAGRIVLDTPIAGVIIDAVQVSANDTRFVRGFTQRSPAKLEEFVDNTLYLIGKINDANRTGKYPMTPTSCTKYSDREGFGGCPFRSVCSAEPSLRENFIRANYETRFWNPLEKR